MQRFIARRVLQSILAIWVMSLIVFALARLSGNALDVMLPMEASQEDYERLAKYWGLDQPVHVQYGIFIAGALRDGPGDGPPPGDPPARRLRAPGQRRDRPAYRGPVRGQEGNPLGQCG